MAITREEAKAKLDGEKAREREIAVIIETSASYRRQALTAWSSGPSGGMVLMLASISLELSAIRKLLEGGID